ncbi:response regulator transcription factor [Streptomyces alboniger]|uniref:DNA-binding response regulator n=1 Tax=Streptomyces alboniger TaxID=132473 RepID=A0A5J6I0K5_STRAD|nr:response regulator transcription factor [Streptomyces alboniger]QEV22445.1 DNA-binding response regulator [Streptomyces alboniger]
MIDIAVVDDDRMLLDGLRAWLSGQQRLRLVGTVSTVDALLAGPARTAAVVLLDLVLGDGSRPEANVRRVRAAGSKVLVISTIADHARVVAAVAAGADGYLTKDHALDTLVEAVETVAAGGTAHSPELAFGWVKDTTPTRPHLAPRERQVLRDYASGLTLKATARRAGITVNTAKYYLDQVKEKYRQAGRPALTKIDLARRLDEDDAYGGRLG